MAMTDPVFVQRCFFNIKERKMESDNNQTHKIIIESLFKVQVPSQKSSTSTSKLSSFKIKKKERERGRQDRDKFK